MNTIEKLHALRQLGQSYSFIQSEIYTDGHLATLREIRAGEEEDVSERVSDLERAIFALESAFDDVISAACDVIAPLDVRHKAERQAERRARKEGKEVFYHTTTRAGVTTTVAHNVVA